MLAHVLDPVVQHPLLDVSEHRVSSRPACRLGDLLLGQRLSGCCTCQLVLKAAFQCRKWQTGVLRFSGFMFLDHFPSEAVRSRCVSFQRSRSALSMASFVYSTLYFFTTSGFFLGRREDIVVTEPTNIQITRHRLLLPSCIVQSCILVQQTCLLHSLYKAGTNTFVGTSPSRSAIHSEVVNADERCGKFSSLRVC